MKNKVLSIFCCIVRIKTRNKQRRRCILMLSLPDCNISLIRVDRIQMIFLKNPDPDPDPIQAKSPQLILKFQLENLRKIQLIINLKKCILKCIFSRIFFLFHYFETDVKFTPDVKIFFAEFLAFCQIRKTSKIKKRNEIMK